MERCPFLFGLVWDRVLQKNVERSYKSVQHIARSATPAACQYDEDECDGPLKFPIPNVQNTPFGRRFVLVATLVSSCTDLAYTIS
jgi:hypothetical protein